MAWTNFLDAVLAHKKPITLQILRGLRDNIISLAAGDPGAPRVTQSALLEAVSGAGTEVVRITGALEDGEASRISIGCIADASVRVVMSGDGNVNVLCYVTRNGAFQQIQSSNGTFTINLEYGDNADVSAIKTAGGVAESYDIAVYTVSPSPRVLVLRQTKELPI